MWGYSKLKTNSMSEESGKDIQFPVSTIRIKLDLNLDKKNNSIIFDRSMIQTPVTTRKPGVTSDKPFFTKHIKYPSQLESKIWQDKFLFFFDRDTFVKKLQKHVAENPSDYVLPGTEEQFPEKLMEFEKHNIMIMLRCIFAIPEAFGYALQNSYDHILLKKGNQRIIKDLNLKSAINVMGFLYRFGVMNREKQEYFILMGNKKYVVVNVVWINDVVNQPNYNAFLQSYHTNINEVRNNISKIETQLATYKSTLQKELTDGYNRSMKLKGLKKMYETVVPNASADDFVKLMNKPVSKIKSEFDSIIGSTGAITDNTDLKALFDILEIKPGSDQDQVQLDAGRKKEILKEWVNLENITEAKDHRSLYALLKHIEAKRPQQGAITTSDSALRNANIEICDKLEGLADVNPTLSEADIVDTVAQTFIDIQSIMDNNGGKKAFINGPDIEFYFNKILMDNSIGIVGTKRVLNFAKNGITMIFSDKDKSTADSASSTNENSSNISRKIQNFIKTTFASEATYNDDLIKSVNDVFMPARKTSNPKLYELIRRVKTGKWPETPDADKEKTVFKKIYEQYLSIYENNVSDMDFVNQYVYSGVDFVNEKSESFYEITVLMNLVSSEHADADCGFYDKMLEQEYLNQIDPQNPKQTKKLKYRNLEPDKHPNENKSEPQITQPNEKPEDKKPENEKPAEKPPENKKKGGSGRTISSYKSRLNRTAKRKKHLSA